MMFFRSQPEARIWELDFSLNFRTKGGTPLSRKHLSRVICDTHISAGKSHGGPFFKSIQQYLDLFRERRRLYRDRHVDLRGFSPPCFGGRLKGDISVDLQKRIDEKANSLPGVHISPDVD